MLIAIISDTHLPRGERRVPEACVEQIRTADLLLHAGDFTTAAAYGEIEAIGPPLLAVHGNVDDAELARRRLPEERIVEAGGARIAMLHDAGPRGATLVHAAGASGSAPKRWCSATPTCRCTKSATASRSSTRTARPSDGGPPRTPWASRVWRTGA